MISRPRKENAVILAIESSCDETACAILRGGRELLANKIISSASQHVKFGGVVPEIASRAHTDAIGKVVRQALEESGLGFSDIDAVAVTYGAGLLGALLVGVSYAKALAFALDIPLVPVSHIRGHLAAAYLADKTLEPPFVSLLASGGHTAIMVVKDYDDFEYLGGTLDDAVGEAFDKVARVLGLDYPGGPNVERMAKNGKNMLPLPKMLKGNGGYNFSYSGLKTAVINLVHNAEQKGETLSREDLCMSFQSAAIDILCEKAVEAAVERNLHTITVGGGVGANGYLRDKLSKMCAYKSIKLVLPEKGMCTDNAAMIGAEGFVRYQKGDFADLTLNAKASVKL
jgi:N6-L-threonylcarbamoyladenine synthase